MRIPHTIPRNVFEAYRCSVETSRLPNERERRIRAEDATWDEGLVPELKDLALRVLVAVWQDNPILEELPSCTERDALLETLPTDLPFELLITRIHEEHFWERCAKDRWQYNDPEEHGGSWRRLYCERHFCEYLENLEASYFESRKEDCERLIKLLREYVYAIKLRSLRPTKKATTLAAGEDEDPCRTQEDVVHHIPMEIILPQFPHLEEIYLNFGVIYMNDGFEWRDFEFSVEDCEGLGQGIKACRGLKKLALTRSNLDQPRVAALLQKVVENQALEELDFSHCKLRDTGAHAVGEFLSMHSNLQTLRVANNEIGPNGLAGIMYGLLKKSTNTLKHLDLRMNPLQDTGMAHICAFLLRNDSLEVLNVSGCEFGVDGGTALAEVLSSGYVKIESLVLDVSNNDFGPTVGEAFEVATKSSPYIVGLDGRMCNFSEDAESSIWENVLRNKDARKKEKTITDGGSVSVQSPQQQPEVDPTSAQQGFSNSSTSHIRQEDVGMMKSILMIRNMASVTALRNHEKFKASFGKEESTRGDRTVDGNHEASKDKTKTRIKFVPHLRKPDVPPDEH